MATRKGHEGFMAASKAFDRADANKDGVLSAEDWLFTPGGSSKWDTLRKNFDLDGSGGVEPAEFMSGLKTLALKEVRRF